MPQGFCCHYFLEHDGKTLQYMACDTYSYVSASIGLFRDAWRAG